MVFAEMRIEELGEVLADAVDKLVERVATDIMFADVDNQMHYICRKS